MARLFDDASSEYASVASAPATAAPLTISAWVYPDVTGDQYVAWIGNSAVDDAAYAIQLTAGGAVRGVVGASGFSTFDATGSYTLNAWQHVCLVEASTTSRTVYRDGANSATNSDSRVPAGLNQFGIGVQYRPTIGTYFSGRIAEVAIWSAALDAAEVAALAKRFSPRLIRPTALVGYWPLNGIDSPELDRWKNGYNLTLTNTPASAEHCPLLHPCGPV